MNRITKMSKKEFKKKTGYVRKKNWLIIFYGFSTIPVLFNSEAFFFFFSNEKIFFFF